MWQRMDYNASGAAGTILACTHGITLTTTNAATVPVTGIIHGGNTEEYIDPAHLLYRHGGERDGTCRALRCLDSSTASPTTPGAITHGLVLAQPRWLAHDELEPGGGYLWSTGSTADPVPRPWSPSIPSRGPAPQDAEVTTDTTYAVTAIADDCCKAGESTATWRVCVDGVQLTSLDAESAGSALSVASLLVIPLVGLVLVLGRRRQENRS